MCDDFAQARLDMFEAGLFGQGPAFWRWIETDAAQPENGGAKLDHGSGGEVLLRAA